MANIDDQNTVNETSEPAKQGEPEANTIMNAEPFSEVTDGENIFDPNKMGILNDVSILITIEVGRAQIKIRDLLNLTKDSILDLNKLAGEPVDVYANGKLISKGNIITANGKYCVRLLSLPKQPI